MLKLFKIVLFFSFAYTNLLALAQETHFSLNRCETKSKKTQVVVNSSQQGIVINNNIRSKTLSFKINNSLAGDFIIGLTSLTSKMKLNVC